MLAGPGVHRGSKRAVGGQEVEEGALYYYGKNYLTILT